MEQTSAETLTVFKQKKNLIDNRVLDQLQHILSLADLVKFAKYTPLVDDNNQTLMNAYFFVNQTKIEEVNVSEDDAGNSDEEEIIENNLTK